MRFRLFQKYIFKFNYYSLRIDTAHTGENEMFFSLCKGKRKKKKPYNASNIIIIIEIHQLVAEKL